MASSRTLVLIKALLLVELAGAYLRDLYPEDSTFFLLQAHAKVEEDGCAHCTIWADARVLSFDAHHPVDQDGGDELSVKEVGTYWLVNTKDIHIQGRYWKDTSNNKMILGALAVGGSFLQNSSLIIRSSQGAIKWNTDVILESIPSDFNHELITAHSKNDSLLVATGKGGPATEINLPDGVSLLVNRFKTHVNAQITMCGGQREGQTGQCGNFNGVATDDAQDLSAHRIEETDQILFDRNSDRFIGQGDNRNQLALNSTSAAEAPSQSLLRIGDRVQVRDDENTAWTYATVTSLEPPKAKFDQKEGSSEWTYMVKVERVG